MITKMESSTGSGTTTTSGPEERLEYVRNNKEFRVDRNRRTLRIVGNGNRIYVKQNCGLLEVIGNDTGVWIVNNGGDVLYTGNAGKVFLGDQSVNQACEYVGANGQVAVLGESVIVERMQKKKCKRDENNASPKRCSSGQPDKPTKGIPSKEDNKWTRAQKEGRRDDDGSVVIKNNIQLPSPSRTCGLEVSSKVSITRPNGGHITVTSQIVL